MSLDIIKFCVNEHLYKLIFQDNHSCVDLFRSVCFGIHWIPDWLVSDCLLAGYYLYPLFI